MDGNGLYGWVSMDSNNVLMGLDGIFKDFNGIVMDSNGFRWYLNELQGIPMVF